MGHGGKMGVSEGEAGGGEKTFESTRRIDAFDAKGHLTPVTQPQPHEKYGEATSRQVVGCVLGNFCRSARHWLAENLAAAAMPS